MGFFQFPPSPHDLAPSLINSGADWYSFWSNAASILGCVFAIASLCVTILVKRQVREIEKKYRVQLKGANWSKAINSHANNLMKLSAEPFDQNKVRVEMVKATNLLRSFSKDVPKDTGKSAKKLVTNMKKMNRKSWFRRKVTVTVDQTIETSLSLTDIGDSLLHASKTK
jgi:hypothetical protein